MPKRRYTVEEYLAFERQSEERHEFLDGRIYPAGSPYEYIDIPCTDERHESICTNLVNLLKAESKGVDYLVLANVDVYCPRGRGTQKDTASLHAFSDIVVVSGKPNYHSKHPTAITNPVVIVEVLSPSTEIFDRGEKWLRYQTWLPSLTNYVLVSQSVSQIEQYVRQSNGEWIYSLVLDGSLHLASINYTLKLSDVYDRVIFAVDSNDFDDEA